MVTRSLCVLSLGSEIRVTFPTARFAGIAVASLEVDEELQPDKITKQLTQDGASLVA